MVALKIPVELKKITPYVRRAEELDKDKTNPESRLVAYYCRQYAVHTGIPLAGSDEGKSCLGELLGNLEGEKQAMDAFTRDEAKFLCSKFAFKIFDNADLEDRTGEATKNTARVFYAAGSFLDILQQFYQDDDQSEDLSDIKKKIKYSKWKAAEILKAINEGRKPTSGGYDENISRVEDEENEDTPVTTAEEVGPIDPLPTSPAFTASFTEDDSLKEVEASTLPSVIPTPLPEQKDEEGTEIELGPPTRVYTGPALAPVPVSAPSVQKPPPTPSPPSSSVKLMPPPYRKDLFNDVPAVAKPKTTSIFGFGGSNTNKSKLSKTEIADATELTTFALAALNDKDTNLAADRLEQALRILGRR